MHQVEYHWRVRSFSLEIAFDRALVSSRSCNTRVTCQQYQYATMKGSVFCLHLFQEQSMQLQKGFTLAEAAVSLAILGIMAALTTPNYLAELQQRRAEVTVADTQAIVDAARSYRVSNGV